MQKYESYLRHIDSQNLRSFRGATAANHPIDKELDFKMPLKESRLSPKTGEVRRTLSKLIVEQNNDLQNPDIVRFKNNNSPILEAYSRTKIFRNLMSIARNEVANIQSYQQLKDFKVNFLGLTFENIAFLAMIKDYGLEQTVLSHEQTFKFFKKLNPRANTIHTYLGNKTLMGISIPDSIITKKFNGVDKITGLVEYTAFSFDKGGDFFQKDYINENNNLVMLSYRHPEILHRDAKVILVTPAETEDKKFPELQTNGNFIHMPLKLTHKELGKFVSIHIPLKP
jgi:hypothetical protein